MAGVITDHLIDLAWYGENTDQREPACYQNSLFDLLAEFDQYSIGRFRVNKAD
jgi:hypothetical protein